MAKEFGQLYVGVQCANCGKHGEGVPTDSGRTRCGKCGAFGKELDNYCVEHDTYYENIYPNDTHCPACREERRVQDQRMHEATRDPTMEPW